MRTLVGYALRVLPRTDGLDQRVCTEVFDSLDSFVAVLFDDVGCTTLKSALLSRQVAAHRNCPFRLQLSGGEPAEQADRAVAVDESRPDHLRRRPRRTSQ